MSESDGDTKAAAAPGGETHEERGAKPIWEMELLISGALVFSLLQLPAPMLRELLRLSARLAGGESLVATTVMSLALTVVIILAASFVVHLAGRAFWIGLIGLRHVFPDWVRWERLKHGPATAAVNRQIAANPGKLIDGLDRFCSMIFSLAFSLVGIVVVEALLMGLLALLAGVAASLIPGVRFTSALAVLIGGPLLVGLGLSGVDSLIGKGRLRRLAANASFCRFTTAYLKGFTFVLGGPLWSPAFLVLRSNLDLRRYAALMTALVVALGICVPLATIVASSDIELLQSLRYFPSDGRRFGVNSNHYRDARSVEHIYLRTPSIQSEDVQGPVIRLFLPHLPAVDNDLMAEVCPGLAPLRSVGIALNGSSGKISDERLVAARDCLRALWQVELDGTVHQSGDYFFFTEPDSGVHGLMGYLSSESLAPGRHELRVRRYAAKVDEAQSTSDKERYRGREDTIQFWLVR